MPRANNINQAYETPNSYLKEKNCLRDKLSQFSRIFALFARSNPREKSTGNQFAKLNPREKIFFRVLELAKLTFFIRFSINYLWSCQKYFIGYKAI